MTKRAATAKTTFQPKIRSAWGYQDALADKQAGRLCKDELWLARHFDKHYAAGYREGKYTNEEGAN